MLLYKELNLSSGVGVVLVEVLIKTFKTILL